MMRWAFDENILPLRIVHAQQGWVGVTKRHAGTSPTQSSPAETRWNRCTAEDFIRCQTRTSRPC